MKKLAIILCLSLVLGGVIPVSAAQPESPASVSAPNAEENAVAPDTVSAEGADVLTTDDQTADPAPGDTSEPATEPKTGENSEPETNTAVTETPQEIVQTKTKLTGVPKKINKRKSQKASFTVKVTPANGKRTVLLQRYNSKTKKWKTIKTYQSKDADTASVKITIAAKYRSRTTGKWRIKINANAYGTAVNSKTFTVTTRNLATQNVSARAVCIYCVETGEAIYTKNSETRYPQASTTKLMTALLAAESGKLKKGKTTVISKKAAKTPWGSRQLKAGDKYRTIDLLYAMMLPSSNDAATAMAETVGGSYSKFIKKMNTRAKKLGMEDTHYKNPHGLDAKGHYSTAKDVAILTAKAYKNPTIRKTFKTSKKTITSLRKKRRWTLRTTDKLLGYSKAFKGGKTGTTDYGRCCFAGVYTWKGKTYVTVVLGSNYGYARWTDTKKLHNYIKKYAATRY